MWTKDTLRNLELLNMLRIDFRIDDPRMLVHLLANSLFPTSSPSRRCMKGRFHDIPRNVFEWEMGDYASRGSCIFFPLEAKRKYNKGKANYVSLTQTFVSPFIFLSYFQFRRGMTEVNKENNTFVLHIFLISQHCPFS